MGQEKIKGVQLWSANLFFALIIVRQAQTYWLCLLKAQVWQNRWILYVEDIS